MHYYQFNIGDYSKTTKYLSPMEDLAYRRMLDMAYDSESPLPCEIPRIAKLIGLPQNQAEIREVLNEFWQETSEGWINKRVSEELEKYTSKAELARANGRMGGRPKKPRRNPEETQSVILANPELTESKANHKPITNNQETDIKDTCALQAPEHKKVPYDEILNLYHKILPSLPRVKVKTEARLKSMKARHITNLNSKLENWEGYFTHIRDNCTWMLSGNYSIDFDYVITQKNYVKILEGTKNDR